MSLPWGQAFEKFLSMVQAGETPDIVEMPERWMGLYANNGQLEDLGPYMKDWAEAGTLGDRAKQFGSTVKNTQYMIPYGYYIRAMFWNKKLFAEAGLSGPPQTIEEFVADARRRSPNWAMANTAIACEAAPAPSAASRVHEYHERQARLSSTRTARRPSMRKVRSRPADAAGHLQERLGARRTA